MNLVTQSQKKNNSPTTKLSAIFFADLSLGVGRGHWSRCNALASIFQSLNIQTELKDTKELLESFKTQNKAYKKYSFMIIDSYILDLEIYNWAARQVVFAFFFDDTFRLNYPNGAIINGAFGADYETYKQAYPKAYLCIGERYFLAQKEFLEYCINPYARENIEKILLCFGSGDVLGLLPKVLKWLEDFKGSIYCVGVNLASLRQNVSINPTQAQVEFCENLSTKEMQKLLVSVDLAFLGAGQSLSEAIACGIPSIAFSLVDNQEPNIKPFLTDKTLIYGISRAWELSSDTLEHTCKEAFKYFLPQSTRTKAKEIAIAYKHNLQWKSTLQKILHSLKLTS